MQRTHKTMAIAALLAMPAIFHAPTAEASMVHWTLSDVVLSDGQSLSGSFDYDADVVIHTALDTITGAYSNISISNSGSSTWASNLFTEGLKHNYTSSQILYGFDGSGAAEQNFLTLLFATPLSNDGGTVELASHDAWGFAAPIFWRCDEMCSHGIGSVLDEETVVALQGTVVGMPSPVPLPAAAWLLLSGIGGVSVFGRRRKGGEPAAACLTA